MKKRLNILCVLVFVAIGIGFLPFLYAMGLGVQMGVQGGDGAQAELNRMVNAEQVHLMPVQMTHLAHVTVDNLLTGEAVTVWPERIVADVEVSYPGWYTVLNTVCRYLVYVALVAIVVLFLKFIVRVNRGHVFEWRNVRLLRWLGGLELGGSIVTTMLQVYGAGIVGRQFALSGYAPDYFSYVSATELSVGLVALIAAEIFAIGLKMKEDQDLTI
ncbi:MAG: DUF2975 domain-containing protein [Prevotella sp.]|nr:DUF2975 domain-containing protein [Prevotella sp.]